MDWKSADGCKSEEPNQWVFSMLAEIGYCTLLAGAVEEIPDGE